MTLREVEPRDRVTAVCEHLRAAAARAIELGLEPPERTPTVGAEGVAELVDLQVGRYARSERMRRAVVGAASAVREDEVIDVAAKGTLDPANTDFPRPALVVATSQRLSVSDEDGVQLVWDAVRLRQVQATRGVISGKLTVSGDDGRVVVINNIEPHDQTAVVGDAARRLIGSAPDHPS